jgi:uncharacterized Fe-S center protein
MNEMFTKAAASVPLVAVNAGVSDPSTTRMLADRIAQKILDRLTSAGSTAVLSAVDLGETAMLGSRDHMAKVAKLERQSRLTLFASQPAVASDNADEFRQLRERRQRLGHQPHAASPAGTSECGPSTRYKP